MKISKLTVTPVAIHDQPLLNSTGVHESYRERTIVQIETGNGYTGAGETHGGKAAEIETNRNWIVGADPSQITKARLSWIGSPQGWAAVETALGSGGTFVKNSETNSALILSLVIKDLSPALFIVKLSVRIPT